MQSNITRRCIFVVYNYTGYLSIFDISSPTIQDDKKKWKIEKICSDVISF
jgi:hypothetical protein